MNVNGTCGIHRFPIETLSHIFSFLFPASHLCLGAEGGSDDFPYVYSDLANANRDLESAVSVCYQWRAAALSASSLWSTITAGGSTTPAKLKILLKRSGAHPLRVYLSTHTELETYDLLNANAFRIKDFLYVSYADVETRLSCLSRMSNTAPILQSLYLGWQYDTDVVVDLASLFAGQTPSLTRLQVGPWQPPPTRFLGLTRLRLTHLQDDQDMPFDFLIDTLRANPALEELVLYAAVSGCCFTCFADRDGITREMSLNPVHLPRLSYLYVAFHYAADLHIFNHLVLPDTHECLVVDSTEQSEEIDEFLLPFLNTYVATLGQVSKLSICHREKKLDLLCINKRGTILRFRVNPAASANPPAFHGKIWDGILSRLSFEDTTELWIESDVGIVLFSEVTWTDVLRAMPSLQTLCARGDVVNPILQALPAIIPDSRTCLSLICPKLQTLIIHNEPEISIRHFEMLLQSRFQLGHPIPDLRISFLDPDVYEYSLREELRALKRLRGIFGIQQVQLDLKLEEDRLRMSVPWKHLLNVQTEFGYDPSVHPHLD
ncbi:uncharacterized protein FIBRA_00385 [Fibroporia radiculosa]|uniref:F-box domain-containing protein n=1 Tax=Fibroporia radiculosa TaxID=599839 RepID=J4GHN5_9APHY|nr:uncharacterized protein FIBRA_00385 [Fibroporia radiculosa]CCL98390.1 predicted protein [Fibroporia radiculosa]